jgi:hypothetical protein
MGGLPPVAVRRSQRYAHAKLMNTARLEDLPSQARRRHHIDRRPDDLISAVVWTLGIAASRREPLSLGVTTHSRAQSIARPLTYAAAGVNRHAKSFVIAMAPMVTFFIRRLTARAYAIA